MISVILATHNGADTIERTLAAMTKIEAPEDGWELLLVNNASTDDTECLARAWADRLPLHYLYETKLGKCYALNLGLAHAKGELIIMTDDDVLPDRDWLLQWRRTVDAFPQCAVFGGTVVPEFGADSPPSNIPVDYYGVLYGATQNFPEGPLMQSPLGLFDVAGANLAIRRSVHDEGNSFDSGFLVGSVGLMGEDTEFVKRLSTAGYGVGFAPRARLRHLIDRKQYSRRWIRRRFYRHGRAVFMLRHARWDSTAKRYDFDFPWTRFKPALGSYLRMLLAKARHDEKNAFRQSLGLMYDLTSIEQATYLSWRQAFRRRP